MLTSSPAPRIGAACASFLGAAALLAAPATAQSLAEGFRLDPEPHPLALNFLSTLTTPLPGGDLLTFDGRLVERRDPAGNPIATLFDVGQDVFGSFLVVSPDGTLAVLGESSMGMLYRIDLINGTGAAHEFVDFNFSAAFESSSSLIVSAATSSFANNDIVRVDLDQPNIGFTPLATVPGASGPVAVLSNGDIVYGLPPSFGSMTPGESDLIRFDASDLGAGTLGVADSTPFATGFDGAGGLLYDPGCDCLYLAENNFNLGVARLRRVVPPAAAISPILYTDPFGRTVGFSSLVSPTAPGQLSPYQPEEFSGSITFSVTDFFSSDQRLTLRPQRPAAALTTPGSGGAGSTDFTVTDGPAGGFLVLAFGAAAGGTELPLPIPGQDPALFTGLDLAGVGLLQQLFPLDGAGGFAATVPSAQVPPGVAFQGLVYGGSPFGPLGTTTVALP